MKFTCLIIDDEPIAREIIEKYLHQFPQIDIVGRCADALEANRFLHRQYVDFVFLDIEMPHVDGLSFIKALEHPPKVIITTAHRDYALDGHELNVVDYLLKPISQQRFLKAINRILITAKGRTQARSYFYIKVDLKMVQVFLDEILYIQGMSNYVRIFCVKRTLITYQKLSYLEEVLSSDEFVRIHRSYIVSLDKISSYNTQELEIGHQLIPIGGSYRERLLKALANFEA